MVVKGRSSISGKELPWEFRVHETSERKGKGEKIKNIVPETASKTPGVKAGRPWGHLEHQKCRRGAKDASFYLHLGSKKAFEVF